MVNMSMQKVKENDGSLPEILIIKVSGNLFGESIFAYIV